MKNLFATAVVLAAVLWTGNVSGGDAGVASPEHLIAEFALLNRDDVEWQGIDWRTCLLDGIRQSRDQHKPMMLWIFIDRPIDDEQC